MGIFDFFKRTDKRRGTVKKREDIKLKVNSLCNLKKGVGKRWSKGEMKCCICGNTQVALPSAPPLKQAIANRLAGQNIAGLRSCIAMYCKDCGHVVCLECVSVNSLNDCCPECGRRLQYLTISVLQKRGIRI